VINQDDVPHKKGALPAGFFDDKEKDKALQGIVKPDFSAEMEEFQLVMKETDSMRRENLKKARLELDKMRKRAEQKEDEEKLSRLESLKLKVKKFKEDLLTTNSIKDKEKDKEKERQEELEEKESQHLDEELADEQNMLLFLSDEGMGLDWRAKGAA